MNNGVRRLGLTGATGYIARAVIARARAHGWEVISIGRRAAIGACAHRHADLAQPIPPGLMDDLDAVMHLAASSDGGASLGDAERSFAQALAAMAAGAGRPFLFTSSQAAAPDAPSLYGRTKAAIESTVLPLGAIVVRPGLVYGGVPAGLFGLLVGLVRRLPLLPDLLPRPGVQPVHVDDLVDGLFAAIERPQSAGRVLAIAGPRITFRKFVAMIASRHQRVRRIWLPTPVPVLRGVLSLCGALLDRRLSPERLDSLVRAPVLDAGADLAYLQIHLRDLRDGLSRSGHRRRRILEEARALSAALLGPRALPNGMLRRYVRIVESHFGGIPLELPQRWLRHASMLAALDTIAARRGGPGAEVTERLTILSQLAEAEPLLVGHFMLLPAGKGHVRFVAGLVRAGVSEIRARCCNAYARRQLRRVANG